MSASKHRLHHDVAELAEDTDGIFLRSDTNIYDLEVAICGLEGSDFDSGMFLLKIEIPSSFPNKAPRIYFKTKVFHPNISRHDGEVCIDILKEKWAPSITLKAACKAIQLLLDDPYIGSPLNVDAANMLRYNGNMYHKTVRMWTKYLAGGSLNTDPEYEKGVELVTSEVGKKCLAVKILTASKWDVQGVFNSLERK